jgi:hypothetical protein
VESIKIDKIDIRDVSKSRDSPVSIATRLWAG